MTTALYVVESHLFTISHGARESQGVLGVSGATRTQKIYLHVIPIAGAELTKLRAKKDDAGNADHTRFALPGRDDWWVAVEGEAAWPGIFRPRITSHFGEDMTPAPLSDAEVELLRKAGLQGL